MPIGAAGAVAAWARDHAKSPPPSVRRGAPVFETSAPAGAIPKPYPSEKAAAIRPFVVSLKPRSAAIGMIATPITTLSKEQNEPMAQQRASWTAAPDAGVVAGATSALTTTSVRFGGRAAARTVPRLRRLPLRVGCRHKPPTWQANTMHICKNRCIFVANQ